MQKILYEFNKRIIHMYCAVICWLHAPSSITISHTHTHTHTNTHTHSEPHSQVGLMAIRESPPGFDVKTKGLFNLPVPYYQIRDMRSSQKRYNAIGVFNGKKNVIGTDPCSTYLLTLPTLARQFLFLKYIL